MLQIAPGNICVGVQKKGPIIVVVGVFRAESRRGPGSGAQRGKCVLPANAVAAVLS